MSERPLDMRQLRQVLEICREGGITRAARALGISQPTLSKSVRRMEDQLGVSLFDHKGGRTTPNALAQHIASRAAAIVENASNVSREVRAIASGHGAPLRVGVGAASKHLFDRVVLSDLLATLPQLRIEMHQDTVPNLIRGARASELDMIITSYNRDAALKGLTSRRLIDDDVYFVARTGHPLSAVRKVGIEELLEFPLASPGLYVDLQRLLPDDLPEKKVRNVTAFVCQDYHSIFDMVLASNSITYAPWYIIDQYCPPGTFSLVDFDLPISYHSFIFTNEFAESSPFVRTSSEVIQRAVARDHLARNNRKASAWEAFAQAQKVEPQM